MTERPRRRYECIAHGLEPHDREPATHEATVEAVDATEAQDMVWNTLEAEGWRVDGVAVEEAPPTNEEPCACGHNRTEHHPCGPCEHDCDCLQYRAAGGRWIPNGRDEHPEGRLMADGTRERTTSTGRDHTQKASER